MGVENFQGGNEIQDYQEKYIPDYLKIQEKKPSISRRAAELVLSKKVERHGLENIPPDGPFLIVSNHFNNEESEILSETFRNYDAHHTASETVHFRSSVRRAWLKRMRVLSAPESLTHLTEEEKQALLKRIPKRGMRKAYEKIVKREKDPHYRSLSNRRFIRESTALLSRGDVVIVYPEGLWLYDGKEGGVRKQEMYQGYKGGVEAISREYKRLTGKDLPILPIAIYKDQKSKKRIMQVGKLMTPDSESSGLVDKSMTEVARMLPEEQRGYYKEMAAGDQT